MKTMLVQDIDMGGMLAYVESGELLPILVEGIVIELDELFCAFVSYICAEGLWAMSGYIS